MKTFIFSLITLLSCVSFGQGNYTPVLTYLSGSVDPSVVATNAPKGSFYFSTNGNIYIKSDDGYNTHWKSMTGVTSLTGDVTASGAGPVAATVKGLRGVPVSATTPTDGYVLTYVASNSDWEPAAAGGGGGGANTTLSNLTSPIAVNQNFDPDVGFTREMGASTPWEGIVMNDLTVINTTEAQAFDITITDSPTTFGYLTDVYGYWQAEGGSTAITTNPGGGIILFSGNVTSGPGASGDVVLQVGTSTGTVGNIRLITGATASVAGQVWTATDTNGAGHWAAVQLATSGSQPTCDVAHRGLLWNVQGGTGVADVFQICQKDSSDVYGWTTH